MKLKHEAKVERRREEVNKRREPGSSMMCNIWPANGGPLQRPTRHCAVAHGHVGLGERGPDVLTHDREPARQRGVKLGDWQAPGTSTPPKPHRTPTCALRAKVVKGSAGERTPGVPASRSSVGKPAANGSGDTIPEVYASRESYPYVTVCVTQFWGHFAP
jgi:hypothetical protein